MTFQTQADAKAELARWYEARKALADGKSYTISTENGTRTLTSENLADVNAHIQKLERRATCPPGQSHNFAVANLRRR